MNKKSNCLHIIQYARITYNKYIFWCKSFFVVLKVVEKNALLFQQRYNLGTCAEQDVSLGMSVPQHGELW